MEHSSEKPTTGLESILADIVRSKPMLLGPLTDGIYIQIGMGTGFYVPETAYNAVKARANELRRIQFLTVLPSGVPWHGSREDCLRYGNGMVAWIHPD